jgi:hypothetical protein
MLGTLTRPHEQFRLGRAVQPARRALGESKACRDRHQMDRSIRCPVRYGEDSPQLQVVFPTRIARIMALL